MTKYVVQDLNGRVDCEISDFVELVQYMDEKKGKDDTVYQIREFTDDFSREKEVYLWRY